MKVKNLNLVWGIALIVAGCLFLAQNLGFFPFLTSLAWVVFFAGLSLVFFACYILAGLRQWGWLFPALISGALALTIGMSSIGVKGSFLGAPILASVAIPFYVAFALDTKRNWWALIPAWVMSVISVVTLIADFVPGEVIGTLILFAIGVPFLAVYLIDRTRWWALIPAGVMFVVGIIPLLTLRFSGDVIGSLIMFLLALPFVVVFIASPRNWWALIPAGVMATIGVVILVAAGRETAVSKGGLISGVLFLGFALTFFALWMMRGSQPTDWAKWPAGVLAIMGVLSIGLGVVSLNFVWPMIIIGIGAFLLYQALRNRPA